MQRAVKMVGKRQILKGQDNYLSLSILAGSMAEQPSSATVSILRPAGTAIVAGAATTYSAGFIRYTLAAALTSSETVGDDWLEQWTCTMEDGEVLIVRRAASLVLRPLYPTVTDDDLYAVYADLRRAIPAVQAGTWEPQRSAAWNAVYSRLWQIGVAAQLVLSSEQLWLVHRAEALALIAAGLDSGAGSKWPARAAEWRDRAAEEWRQLRLDIDADEDGVPEGSGDGVLRISPTGSPVGATSSGRGW